MSAFFPLSIKHQHYPQHCIFPTEGHETAIFPVRSKGVVGAGFGVHAECESEKKKLDGGRRVGSWFFCASTGKSALVHDSHQERRRVWGRRHWGT